MNLQQDNCINSLKNNKVENHFGINIQELPFINKINVRIDINDNQNIIKCFFSDQRCLLFITGKGLSTNLRKKNNKLFFGKLRASIRDWVYNKGNQEKILYFAQAHDKHGGQGSFYIYLRKNKN